jgi:ATP/ADP translocase
MTGKRLSREIRKRNQTITSHKAKKKIEPKLKAPDIFSNTLKSSLMLLKTIITISRLAHKTCSNLLFLIARAKISRPPNWLTLID